MFFPTVISLQLTFALLWQNVFGQTLKCPDSTFKSTVTSCYTLDTKNSSFSFATHLCSQYQSTHIFFGKTKADFTDLINSGLLGTRGIFWYGMTYWPAESPSFVLEDLTNPDNSTYQPWALGQPNPLANGSIVSATADTIYDDHYVDSQTQCVILAVSRGNNGSYNMGLAIVSCNEVHQTICLAPVGAYTTTSTPSLLGNAKTTTTTKRTTTTTAQAVAQGNGNAAGNSNQNSGSNGNSATKKNAGSRNPVPDAVLLLIMFVTMAINFSG